MAICHGKGAPRPDPFLGGCCWVGGEVCPQRWYVDYSTSSPPGDVGSATIFDHQRNSLGTVDDFVATIVNGRPRQDRARQMMQGATFVCGALATWLAENGIPSGANWEQELNAGWSSMFDAGNQAALTGDQWQSIGKPRDWCVNYGPGEGECCFGEDAVTNAAGVAGLHATRVTVASRNLEA